MTVSQGGRPQRLRLAKRRPCSYLGPVVIGEGATEFACGGCFAVVIKGVEIERLAGAIVRCSYCGCLNESVVDP
jgi:predicted RNA-binding Zn-ribbon protein involved in translation (DUF1610 family)